MRRKRVPYVEQLQQTECGLCCVSMMLQYYDSYESLNELRMMLEVGRDGLKISQIKELLFSLGFETNGYKLKKEALKKVQLPAIIYWENEHFVVLERIAKDKYIIVDPAFGRRKINKEDFEESFSNIVITGEPTERFEKVKKPKNVWIEYIKETMKRKKLFVKIAVMSLLTYLITLVVPIFVQYLVDDIVLVGKYDNLNVIIIAFLLVFLVYALLIYRRGQNLVNLQVVLDKSLMGKTFSHMLNLPYKFFETRSYGDILYRLNSQNVIRDMISEQLIMGIIDVGALLVIFIYMMQNSVMLAVVALMLFLMNGMFIFFSRSYIMEENQKEVVVNSDLQGYQVESLYAIFGIKAAGIEGDVLEKWNEKFGEVIDQYKRKSKIINLYTMFVSTYQVISPFIVLWLGINRYIAGVLSLGEVIAFYSIANMFFGLSTSIFQNFNSYLMATTYLKRVNDIKATAPEYSAENPIPLEITGNIKLENVNFSYTAHSAEVLKDISLEINQGEKIAIVGKSGSGKSTLGKVLIGMYEPTGGDIYFDDVNFKRLNKKQIRRQMGIVPQDIALFNKSISENIKLMNIDCSDEKIKEAAQIAQISEEIEDMPMGYRTVLSEMGMNLSGGQRQRIALARAIVSEPKVLVLDEATSSLDSINEKNVAEYFSQASCTRIIIAHRLSTICDADRIYVMEDGEIVESGTHEDLIQKDNYYCKLYQSYN